MIEPVARIRVERQDLEPNIWRRVDVPLSSTLAALHDIIQVSFRWRGYHLHEFVVGARAYGEPREEDEFYERKVYIAAAISLKTLIGRGVVHSRRESLGPSLGALTKLRAQSCRSVPFVSGLALMNVGSSAQGFSGYVPLWSSTNRLFPLTARTMATPLRVMCSE